MKKSIVLIMFVISLLFLLTSCDSIQTDSSQSSSTQTSSSQTTPRESKPKYHFALYYVDESDQSSKNTAFDMMDIDKVVLEKEPWLTENDIEYYDWNTHQIKLKKPFSISLSAGYTRFVLVANDKRMYGVYHQSVFSSMNPPRGVCIVDPRIENIIQLYDKSENGENIKLMNDRTIHNVLKEANILKK